MVFLTINSIDDEVFGFLDLVFFVKILAEIRRDVPFIWRSPLVSKMR
jgi:hypothetical protein